MRLKFIFICVCLILQTIGHAQQSNTNVAGYHFGAVHVKLKPDESSDDRNNQYQNLVNHLAKTLKKPVKLTTFDNYHQLKQAFDNGMVNLAYYKTGDFIEASKQKKQIYPLVIVLTEQKGKIKDNYFSFLITKQPKLTSLGAIENKSFGFNSAYNSMSGYIYPFNYFHSKGINPRNYFKKISFYASSHEAMSALNSDMVSSIAVWDDSFAYNEKYKHYNIITKLGPIPNPPIVASMQLTNHQRQQATKALLNLPAGAFTGLTFVGVKKYQQDFYQIAKTNYMNALKWYPKLTSEIHARH